MRLIGWLLIGAVSLAVLRAAVTGMMLALLAGLTIALVRAPGRTIGTLFVIVILNAFAAHPLAGFVTVSLLLAITLRSNLTKRT